MEMQLSRRQREKVWNVINEIKNLHINAKDNISIALLDGWVLNKKKEGADDNEIKKCLKGRIWAFEYLKNKGIIKIIKMPIIKKGYDGDIIIKIADEKKFLKYNNSCKKSYTEQALKYQSQHKIETNPEVIDEKEKGFYQESDGFGFLEIDGEKIRIGKINTRLSKFVKLFWHKDCFGLQKTNERVMKTIGIDRDRSNTHLNNAATHKSEMKKIISNTQKELRRIFNRHGIKKFTFTVNYGGNGGDGNASVNLKNTKG